MSPGPRRAARYRWPRCPRVRRLSRRTPATWTWRPPWPRSRVGSGRRWPTTTWAGSLTRTSPPSSAAALTPPGGPRPMASPSSGRPTRMPRRGRRGPMTVNHETQARDLLAALPEVTEAHLRALRGRLAERADAEGVLDVAYRTLDTPVGSLLLAATERGLVRVAYPVQGHDQVLESLAVQVSPRILNAPARLDAAARQIDEDFAGRRRAFGLLLDFSLSRGILRTA